MNPKVSIVIPCYGVEKYISNIFDDLKKQNFKDNMEFIFVNDGGSNTLEDITEVSQVNKYQLACL